MALVTTRALVLQAFPYSETSKVLRLYTRDHGLRSALAKGALRPRSRFGGVLEPFTEGMATLYLKDGRDLHTLSGFDLVRSRQALGRSLPAFAGASLLAELVLRLATEEPHPEIHDFLAGSWDAMAAAATPADAEAATLAAAWALVSRLGFEPSVEGCVACGRDLRPDEDARFDAGAGGVACLRCRPVGRVLDAASRAELRRMVRGAPAAPAKPALHRALLRAFLEGQFGHERPFRSLDLWLEHAPAPAPPADGGAVA